MDRLAVLPVMDREHARNVEAPESERSVSSRDPTHQRDDGDLRSGAVSEVPLISQLLHQFVEDGRSVSQPKVVAFARIAEAEARYARHDDMKVGRVLQAVQMRRNGTGQRADDLGDLEKAAGPTVAV